jgi:hypothetical protein
MKGNKSLKKLFTFLLAMQWILTSCTPSSIPKKGSSNLNSETPTTGSSNGGNSGGNGATPGGTDTVIEDTSLPVVEIRNLVEPQIVETNYTSGTGLTGAGSYVRKLTLPKNYSGRLYIGGINVATLADRIVKVRFNFGYNKEP